MRMIIPNVGDDMEQLGHSYIHAGGSVTGTSTLETLGQYLLKLSTRLPGDLATSLLDKYPTKMSAPILPTHENNHSN